MTFRLDVIWRELPQFVHGLGNTVWLCAVSMALSLGLGVLFVVPLMSRRPYVRQAARAASVCPGGRWAHAARRISAMYAVL